MIVISDDVVALGSADASYPVIGYDNVVTTSNITTTTEESEFPASNLANPSTHPPWKGDTFSPLTTEYITIALSGSDTINYLAIANHNFGDIGAILTVEVIVPGFSPDVWTPINFGSPASYTPVDDAPLIFRFMPGMYLGVRLKIEGGDEAPQAGVVYCGQLLVLERSVRVDTTHTPIPMGRRSDISSGRSENGKFLGRIVLGQWSEGQADFAFFTSSWYRTYFKPFVDATDEVPFFFAWFPTEHPEDVGYVWMREDPIAEVNTVVDRIGVSIKYQGNVT
jgi:hypothetical protein